MSNHTTDVLIIGAGIIGISTAYYLKKITPNRAVTLIDLGQPMAFTSAQSGENYRNWWPHPVMKTLTDHSIDLMEGIAQETDNQIHMTRRGYILATRETNIDDLLEELHQGYGDDPNNEIRIHDTATSESYHKAHEEKWNHGQSGVDVLRNENLIKQKFPWYDDSIQTLIHIRRAGTISSQQLGQFMLEQFREKGGQLVQGEVIAIDQRQGFSVTLANSDEAINAAHVVNAAGPFVNRIAEMLGVQLPTYNVLQQKIAFDDTAKAVPRHMPFSIDLDSQHIDWTNAEKELLAEDPDHAWLTKVMPGTIHCRPDGGDQGTWVKLGWAFNETPTQESFEPKLDDNFPEIVVRGAARLNPALKTYYGRLPRAFSHYGGYYTMTEENWPLIGPMDVDGAFVVGAMSGFGTMAACAGGELCAQWISGDTMPGYAHSLAPRRYHDTALITELRSQFSRGLL